jgi:hypothetical protein
MRSAPFSMALSVMGLALLLELSQIHTEARGQWAGPGTPAGPQASPAPSQAASKPRVPRDDDLLIMIRSILMALNEANRTGNYTVFREMAAPGFQLANSSGRLTELFAGLRSRNLDLSPILLIRPKLVRKPQIDPNGMLRLSGFFPSQPEHVIFDLMLQWVGGRWRLFGISVEVAPPRAAKLSATGAQTSSPTAVRAPQRASNELPGELAATQPPLPKRKPAVGDMKPAVGDMKPAVRDMKPAVRDIRDEVDGLEAPAPPAKQAKPKSKDSFNPLNPFDR